MRRTERQLGPIATGLLEAHLIALPEKERLKPDEEVQVTIKIVKKPKKKRGKKSEE